MISEEEADTKMEGGSIRVWIAFEVLAVSESVVKDSLGKMIENLDKDKRISLYKKSFTDIVKVEKPLKNIDIAYSCTCEIECVVKKLEDLVLIVIQYGPSAVEILEPTKFDISSREAQNIMNSVSEMMHMFAAAGVGGLVFLNK